MEPPGKEHMTNGKKLLVAIIVFTAALVGTLATTASSNGTASSEMQVPEADQPPSTNEPSADHVAAVALAELDAFLADLHRQEQEAAKKAAEQAKKQSAQPSVAPNYDPGDGSRWDQLAICESGGNWAYPTVSGGFSGGLMFHYATWNSNGGQEYAPYAYMATREQQIIVAERVLAGSGWKAWPGCSRKFGWL